MRASWKGTISFGLVSIPVKLYGAQKDRSVSFTLLHKECGTPIKYKKWCPHCQKEISSEEIVKAYEISKGQYVVLTEEDFAKLPLKSLKSIRIEGFVPAEQVLKPLLIRKVYYVVPDKGGEKAFVLLRRVLKEEGKVAVAKVTIRNKEYLAAIVPYKNILLLVLLYYADEIVPEAELPLVPEVEVSEEEVELAKELVRMMSKEFEHEKYVDEYRKALEELIRSKLEGKEIVIPETKPEEVKELLEALKATVAAVKKKKEQG